MVVMARAPTSRTIHWQERVASPSRWTVQAPHWPTPHPNLVPVRLRWSRSTQRRGVSGSTSTEVEVPLMSRVYCTGPIRKGVPELMALPPVASSGLGYFCTCRL